jgi:hypothetical protein
MLTYEKNPENGTPLSLANAKNCLDEAARFVMQQNVAKMMRIDVMTVAPATDCTPTRKT